MTSCDANPPSLSRGSSRASLLPFWTIQKVRRMPSVNASECHRTARHASQISQQLKCAMDDVLKPKGIHVPSRLDRPRTSRLHNLQQQCKGAVHRCRVCTKYWSRDGPLL